MGFGEIIRGFAENAVVWLLQLIPQLQYLNPWAFFAGVLIVAFLLSEFVFKTIAGIIHQFTRKTKNKIDDIIVDEVTQPLVWLVFSVLAYIAIIPLPLSDNATIVVNDIMLAANILLVTFVVYRITHAFFRAWREEFSKRTKSKLDDTMLPIVSKFSYVIIWIIGVLITLSSWGVAIGPFLAGLGLAGIAIGFALQDSLSNIFGGISLAMDGAYRVGDKVRIADGTLGIIHDITLRSTRIKTYDGDMVMIPNGKIANDNIYTYAQPKRASRVQVDFGVQYGSDPDKVEDVVLKTVKKIENVVEDPKPTVVFHAMGDSALLMRAYMWVKDYEHGWGVKIQATKDIYKALNKSKIGIPFPTRTVHVKK